MRRAGGLRDVGKVDRLLLFRGTILLLGGADARWAVFRLVGGLCCDGCCGFRSFVAKERMTRKIGPASRSEGKKRHIGRVLARDRQTTAYIYINTESLSLHGGVAEMIRLVSLYQPL